MWDNKHEEEELAHILRYQTLSEDKNWKSYLARTKLIQKNCQMYVGGPV